MAAKGIIRNTKIPHECKILQKDPIALATPVYIKNGNCFIRNYILIEGEIYEEYIKIK
jgi:hypothetical protein